MLNADCYIRKYRSHPFFSSITRAQYAISPVHLLRITCPALVSVKLQQPGWASDGMDAQHRRLQRSVVACPWVWRVLISVDIRNNGPLFSHQDHDLGWSSFPPISTKNYDIIPAVLLHHGGHEPGLQDGGGSEVSQDCSCSYKLNVEVTVWRKYGKGSNKIKWFTK